MTGVSKVLPSVAVWSINAMKRRDAVSDSDARAAWNSGAQAWEEFIESGADLFRHEIHGPALLRACEPVRALEVLDLGCGQGYFSRALAKNGARVVGVDIAEQLISYARKHEERDPLGIEYHAMSAVEVNRHWPKDSFDLVTACMALQDIPDAGGCLKSAHDLLRAEGRLLFSIPHPCTVLPSDQWELESAEGDARAQEHDYFESGARFCRWNMGQHLADLNTPYWRYTLSEWSTIIAEAEFLIARLREPRPTAEQVREQPEFRDSYSQPYFLIFELVKRRDGNTRP
jgi:2-polyprenyl-3-methyl-5-hydroxy-6-metoxy-1,4-benzoquinol methylase